MSGVVGEPVSTMGSDCARSIAREPTPSRRPLDARVPSHGTRRGTWRLGLADRPCGRVGCSGSGLSGDPRRSARTPPPCRSPGSQGLYAVRPGGPDQRRTRRPRRRRGTRSPSCRSTRDCRRRPGVVEPTWPPPASWPIRRSRRASGGRAPPRSASSPPTRAAAATASGPGDGSDGMDGDYMASAGHRAERAGRRLHLGRGRGDLQRQPGLDGRALRLRLRRHRPRPARQTAQNASEGNPVPATPVVAGAPVAATRSTAPARPTGRTAR